VLGCPSARLSFLLRDFFKALIKNDFDIENGRPGSHVLGTPNILWSALERDTIGMKPSRDPYDRED
jgi:hypothetical protein